MSSRSAAEPRAAAVAATLAAHHPADAAEAAALRRIRRLLGWLDHPFDADADPTHVTASAIVLGPDRTTLLHRHRRTGRWLQPGGHLEAGELPWNAAVRETQEETGIVAHHPADGPALIHVDVHEGPRGHVHLDLRYLLLVPNAHRPRPGPGESPTVRWLALADARRLADPSLARALRTAERWLGSDGAAHTGRGRGPEPALA